MVQTIFAISQMTQLKVLKYETKTKYLVRFTNLLLLQFVALGIAIAVGLCAWYTDRDKSYIYDMANFA